MPGKCSLIISTYNWPDALRLTLMSVQQQTVLPSEVIIADDGSLPATRELVDSLRVAFAIPLIHIWHEDKGFRLAAIRNKSFVQASEDYIIQIDGDVILHPRFVEDHLRCARQGYLLQGSRVMLGAGYSEKLINKHYVKVNLMHADVKRKENGIRFPFLSHCLLTKYKNKHPVYFARGANMSFWKQDLLNVNGYNEAFEGWGHEDSDLTLRMMNNGVKKSVIKFAAIMYHLYHPEKKRDDLESKNKQLLESTLQDKTTWIEDGIEKKEEL